jgi:CDP-diacylglycerol--serine O-phosphatidyltransferase
LLTLGNGICGFAAIAYASKITPTSDLKDQNFYYVLSACLILAAMLFDALDGYVARLAKATSDFGGQLDSLCDVISFGVAPAFLLLRLGTDWERPLVRQAIALIAALYVACALLRLARFNVENSPDPLAHKRFKGLPSPAAAGCLASLAILRSELPLTYPLFAEHFTPIFVKFWAPLGTLLASLLMVSRFSYPHFSNQVLGSRRSFRFLVLAVFVVFLIALAPDLAFFVLFWVYAAIGPVRHVLARVRRAQAMAQHRPEVH